MTMMIVMLVLGWVANGPQLLFGVTHTCYTTTVGRVRAVFCSASFSHYVLLLFCIYH